ncbi:YdcF family protein [Pararobbsia silviterrae]|uniref:YdcF family protein n=1 Tax=Pararobbsia silviterrae TaxID=1792498 RepID=A0A494YA62_9BURK|nr:YdcF family protein [Pararobbsia silviterrae]RKP58620.1 YdcF family protein [Pararobbsia silviterrae]
MLIVESVFVVLIVIWWMVFRWLPAWRWLTVTVGVACVAAILSGWFPAFMLARLRVPEAALPPCAPSVSIVVLGGGTRFDDDLQRYVPQRDSDTKLGTALSLYRRCEQASSHCTIFLSGGDPQRHGIAEAEAFHRDLLALGVPDRDIRPEDRSLNTYQNAKYTTPMLGAPGSSQVYLVTAPYHMRRALAMFGRFGVAPIAVASPLAGPLTHDFFRPIRPMLENVRLTLAGVHEVLGLVQLRMYMALGWY